MYADWSNLQSVSREHGALFQSFSEAYKSAEEERKLMENGTPKSKSEKVVFNKHFCNGRMVVKQKCSTQALLIHNWQVLSATLGHCYSQ